MRSNNDPDKSSSLKGLILILIHSSIIISCIGHNEKDNGSDASEELKNISFESGAVTRGDSTVMAISLVFTGDLFAEGGEYISEVLDSNNIRGSFFFTGNFYRNPLHSNLIKLLLKGDHYLGPHSDKHLLYCDWLQRDSLLVTRDEFERDIGDNFNEMKKFGIKPEEASIFLPPYEWYNDSIAAWSGEYGMVLINYTPGTKSHADYTTPSMTSYYSSMEILESVYNFSSSNDSGLNGFILLSHVGAGPERDDKFYLYLGKLISKLRDEGYNFYRIDSLPGLRQLLK